MNKNGQVLVLFIIMIPILLLLFGYIIETSIIAYENEKYLSNTKTIIASTIEEKEKDDIIRLYDDNNLEYKKLDIYKDNDELKIDITYEINSFLGKIINKEKYEKNLVIIGYKKDNKIKYKKG